MSDRCVAKIVLAYDGSDFHGWQIQPRHRTVQGELTQALAKLVRFEGVPPGAGRTDAGVHARGQVSSLEIDREHLPRIARALPRMMPSDIAIIEVREQPLGFHARHSAIARRYIYRMATRYDPMRRLDHLMVGETLDVEAMQRACGSLLGRHDCTSFCRTSSVDPDRTVCDIQGARLTRGEDSLIFEIKADRFLHSMVRVIVGTLVEVGQGKRESSCFPAILAARHRDAAGETAAAHGLCLEEVEYPPTPAA